MPRNALNELKIANGPRKMPNFNMEHAMLYVECRKSFKVKRTIQPSLRLETLTVDTFRVDSVELNIWIQCSERVHNIALFALNCFPYTIKAHVGHNRSI